MFDICCLNMYSFVVLRQNCCVLLLSHASGAQCKCISLWICETSFRYSFATFVIFWCNYFSTWKVLCYMHDFIATLNHHNYCASVFIHTSGIMGQKSRRGRKFQFSDYQRLQISDGGHIIGAQNWNFYPQVPPKERISSLKVCPLGRKIVHMKKFFWVKFRGIVPLLTVTMTPLMHSHCA